MMYVVESMLQGKRKAEFFCTPRIFKLVLPRPFKNVIARQKFCMPNTNYWSDSFPDLLRIKSR